MRRRGGDGRHESRRRFRSKLSLVVAPRSVKLEVLELRRDFRSDAGWWVMAKKPLRRATSHPPASGESPLAEENRRLRARVTQLESRVSSLVRIVRRQEHLRDMLRWSKGRRKRLEARVNELARLLDEGAKTIDQLQSAVTARVDTRLRMCQSYEGDVVDVYGDRVVVVYDVDGNVVEQTYERSQFVDGRLPEVDTDLVVHVIVSDAEPRADGTASEEDAQRDEVPGSRREPLSGPTVF